MSAGFDWRDRNVFVTGATGLLGSWLTEALLQRGANVTVLVRDIEPNSRLVTTGAMAKVSVVHGKVEDHDLMLRAVGDTLAMSPPLIVTEAQIGELFDKVGKIIKAVA